MWHIVLYQHIAIATVLLIDNITISDSEIHDIIESEMKDGSDYNVDMDQFVSEFKEFASSRCSDAYSTKYSPCTS